MSFDVPLIPSIVLATAGVFAGIYCKEQFYFILFSFYIVFNIENKVDLTDRGIAEAKRKRRKEREAKGIVPDKSVTLDPYRYKWFEDDDEDIETLGKPKGGGCG